MAGLCVRSAVSQWSKVAIIAIAVLSFADVAAAGHWHFDDTQYNYDQGYEYEVRLIKWVGEEPEQFGRHDYSYAGPVGEPGFEYYQWIRDILLFVPGGQGVTVWGEVYNRINEGEWYHVDTIIPVWVP